MVYIKLDERRIDFVPCESKCAKKIFDFLKFYERKRRHKKFRSVFAVKSFAR